MAYFLISKMSPFVSDSILPTYHIRQKKAIASTGRMGNFVAHAVYVSVTAWAGEPAHPTATTSNFSRQLPKKTPHLLRPQSRCGVE
jgi:hypothetical protein